MKAFSLNLLKSNLAWKGIIIMF